MMVKYRILIQKNIKVNEHFKYPIETILQKKQSTFIQISTKKEI